MTIDPLEYFIITANVLSAVSLIAGLKNRATSIPWLMSGLKLGSQLCIMAVNIGLGWWIATAANAVFLCMWLGLLVYRRPVKESAVDVPA